MGRGQQRDDPAEALHAQPDDLLLAPHPPVVHREAAGPLADGQVVLDHPGEVARRDAGGPLALHAAGPYSRATCTVAATSWTRTMPRPRHHGRSRRGQRRLDPLRHRRAGSAPAARAQQAQEALAARARPGPRRSRRRPRPRPARAGGAAATGCGPASCRSRSRGRPRPRPPRRRGRARGPLQHEARAPRPRRRRSGGPPAWCAASPCMCMATQPAPVAAATSHSEAEMSLTRLGPGGDRGLGHLGLDGVDRDPDAPPGRPALASASTTGTTRASSTSAGDRLGPGSRRLAAHVDHVGALGHHLEPAGHRRARSVS